MMHSLVETVEVPQAQYTRLIEEHRQKIEAESAAEAPRAIELRAKLDPLIAAVRDENLRLDDDFVATSPRAAELRAEIDKYLPEFQALAEKAANRIATIKHLRARVANMGREETVLVPASEAMMLLGLPAPI